MTVKSDCQERDDTEDHNQAKKERVNGRSKNEEKKRSKKVTSKKKKRKERRGQDWKSKSLQP